MKTARIFAMAFLAAASIPLMAQQVNATGQQQSSADATGTQVNDSTHANGSAKANSKGVQANGSANNTSNVKSTASPGSVHATGGQESSTRAAGTRENNSTQANGSANASPRGVHTNGSAEDTSNVNSTQGPLGFGDASESHAYEMSSVTGELEGKLDAKHAKVGDRVILKTTEKVQTADGTMIPKGTRLVGHVTQVQAHDSAHADSQMGIAFDRAELRSGQDIPIHTLIRGVNPSRSAMAMNSMNSDDQMGAMDAPMGGGGMSGGGRASGGGRSGGGLLGGGGNPAGGVVQRTVATTSPVTERTGPAVNEVDQNTEGTVRSAGHGDLVEHTGAHEFAAARAVPHATAIPGVMLAGNSSASGVFSATKKDVQFENGTQMQLGIVADR